MHINFSILHLQRQSRYFIIVTSGDPSGCSGECITNDENLFDRIGRFSHIGYQLGARRGQAAVLPPQNLDCRNYRATEFQAVILQDQLDRLDADSDRRAATADYLHKELNAITGLGTQKPGRCATRQQYYVFGITVDPAMLKEGKTRDDVLKAVNAEGAVEVFAGWGQPAFRQRLFQVSGDRFRVESSKVVEDIIYNRIMLADIRWLNGERAMCEKLVEAFRKVMQEYGK